MNDDVITKVLALFDEEDILFIKASKFLEYKKRVKENQHLKKVGVYNGKSKMGRVFVPKL